MSTDSDDSFLKTIIPEKVYLFDALTGQTRRLLECEGKPTTVFNWEENNDSCDCNRTLYWARSKGLNTDTLDPDCNHGASRRFTVALYGPNNTLFYSDMPKTWSIPNL